MNCINKFITYFLSFSAVSLDFVDAFAKHRIILGDKQVENRCNIVGKNQTIIVYLNPKGTLELIIKRFYCTWDREYKNACENQWSWIGAHWKLLKKYWNLDGGNNNGLVGGGGSDGLLYTFKRTVYMKMLVFSRQKTTTVHHRQGMVLFHCFSIISLIANYSWGWRTFTGLKKPSRN